MEKLFDRLPGMQNSYKISCVELESLLFSPIHSLFTLQFYSFFFRPNNFLQRLNVLLLWSERKVFGIGFIALDFNRLDDRC